MKGYINKIIAITLLIVVFVVSFNAKFEFDVDKRFRTIANSNKNADTCTTGAGEVYYVNTNSSSATIRNSASSTGGSLGTLTKCTQVIVYCKKDSYSKISKVSEKWILTSALSTSSTACSTINTTTTDPITYGSVSLKYSAYGTKEDDPKQMYRDKPGTIIMTLSGIRNVASDDQDNISVKIVDNAKTDVTNDFDITRTGISDGKATFTIKMKAGLVYSEGQYKVSFGYGTNGTEKVSKTFDLVGRYYNFTINVNKTSGPSSAPANKPNTWKVALENVEPTDAQISDFSIKILNDSDDDCTNNFTIDSNNEGLYFNVSNKLSSSAPMSGEYKMVVKYTNTSYTSVRSNYKQTYTFSIAPRVIEFKELVDYRTSYRYTRYEKTGPYTIKIVKKTDTTITIKELNNEGAYETFTIALKDFNKIYRDFDSSVVEFIDNRPVISFNAIKITRFYNGLYYYFDGVTNKTATLEDLEKDYPGITATINSINATSKIQIYTFDSDGYVEYNSKGNKSGQMKYLQDKSKQILSVTGGHLNFKIKYSYLSDDDKEVMPKITRSDGTVVNARDGFTILKQEYEEGSTEDTTNNIMNLTIDYDNTNEKYTGTYKVTYKFHNVEDEYSFTFSILDGEMDYYLQSTSDGHLTDPFDAYNGTPPGNKRYEWYLGFYMMKSGLLMDEKPSNAMSVRIYNKQADCTDKTSLSTCESSMYFFEQKDYIIQLLKYKDGNVTFNLTYDNVIQSTPITMPINEFKTKYAEAAELFDYYQFDATTGDLLSTNSFRIKVLNVHTYTVVDPETELGKAFTDVTYIDESGNTVTEEATSFNLKYPEFYYNNAIRYVFDGDDNIINGRIRGSLRELTDKDGNPYTGEDVTNQFNISIDNRNFNIEKAITVLPKTEVNAGTYYAYVGFEGALGVGYLNNSNEPVISKESYPEMWNRNIHMSIISYSKPQYDVQIDDPKISNVGNDTNNLYANIDGTAEFKLTPKYIYDYSGFSYRIKKQNGSTWEDVTDSNKFDVTANFAGEQSKVTIKTKPQITEDGKYRLEIYYNNNECDLQEIDDNGTKIKYRYKEFTVNQKYYGLLFDEGEEITFAKNYSQNKYFEATGYYISNPENIQLEMIRVIDQISTKPLVIDTKNKQFKSDNIAVFNYDISYTRNAENPNLLSYTVRLTNVQHAADPGDYQLIAKYQEGSNEISTSVREFKVSDNIYEYTISDEERPRVDLNNKYTIERDVYVSYINEDQLDDINYVIKKYDSSISDYADVSSSDSTNRMFNITTGTPEPYNKEFNGVRYEYKITLYIEVDDSRAPINEDAQFLIDLQYKTSNKEYKFSSLNTIFAWDADLKISGTFQDTKVDRFYLNVSDATLDVKLDTPHENNANFSVTKCIGETCQPSVSHEYNELFDATIERDHIVLKYKNNHTDGIKLTRGEYVLIIYYSDQDKIILPFQVETEFVRIAFDDAIMYSDISESRTVPNLFKNKKGHIEIPVTVLGTSYENTVVKVTDINGNGNYSRQFKYNETSYINDHLLDFTYNADTAEYGEYLITVEYTNADGIIISDRLIFTLNKAYFNFELSEPKYEPNPPIANADPYGKVIYTINTENVFDGLSETEKRNQKNEFAKNTVITNADNVDVTNSFEITSALDSPFSDFDMNLKYLKNQVAPGLYKIKVTYRLHDYNVTKYSHFEISEYEKNILIKSVDVISNTEDGRIHNNTGGIFKINYESIYDISVVDIGVVVKNSSSNTVNDAFKITKYSDYINVELVAKEPAIDDGKYVITVTYRDPQTGKVTTNEDIEVKIYGKYKKILIQNMTPSTSTIYADVESQYYTFDLDRVNISDDELSKMQMRIHDSYGNIVYSSIREDNVTNIFNVSRTESQYKIDILAYKSRVGEYYVELLLENEDNDYNISNRLPFTIDKTKYKIRLSTDSKVTPSNVYNNDETAFYDTDSALVDYKFTSDYTNSDAVYSIKVFNKGIMVREIEDINLGNLAEWGISYLTSIVDIDSLDVGEYEVDICLNGLPYDGRTINVYKYIPVENINLTLNSKIVTSISGSVGTNVEFATYIDPTNATNKQLNITSSDENVFRVNGNTIIPVGKGNAKLIIDHPDCHKEIDITVSNMLSSDIYEIDHVNKTIFVNKLNVKQFTKELLVQHLSNLSSDYTIDNSSVKKKDLVGTSSTLTSGGITYTIIVIGDINCDGEITLNDVTHVFRIYKGALNPNQYQEKAAHIKKNPNIVLNDVTTLFRFYRGTYNEI